MPVEALAQTPKGVTPPALIEDARKDVDDARATLREDADDTTLLDAHRRALGAQTQAETAADKLAADLAAVQARLAELGTPVAGVREPPDIAAQRAELIRSQSLLDAQLKRAKLLSVEAEQAAAAVWAQRRSQFSAKLFERTRAVTSAAFWKELNSEWPADLKRSSVLIDEFRARATAVPTGVWVAAPFALLVLLVLRRPLRNATLQLISTRVPPGRLRRSLYAASVLVFWTLSFGLVAHGLFLALVSGETVSAELRGLLVGIDGIVWFAGFTTGLGMALLMPGKPSWRLSPMTDRTASLLRWFPPALSFGMVLGWVTTQLSTAADASLATTVALKALAAITLLLMIMGAVAQVRRARRERERAASTGNAEQAEGADRPNRVEPAVPQTAHSLWLPTLSVFAWLLLIAALLALLSGYVALGIFVVNQVVWALIIASATYFLAMLIDDLFMTLLAPTVKAPEPAEEPVPGRQTIPPHRTREQIAVVLSGGCRLALLLFALVLLLAPFGEGPLDLARRAGRINEGLAIGEIQVVPATLLEGLIVLFVGYFAVRALKGWLGDKLMPTTRMDAGMRMSITTLFGYIGGIVVFSLAMSAVGVGLERVAWVASALSVGIGFGLQAVVQNFVSGLILLAERPVKVGDWVSLSGVEGDIRRINVRATEIQMGDRSTVIVPNSEFITKIVRNVTYTDPIGMVQIKLPMPLETDTRKAKAVLLDAFAAHPGVLASPAPNVQLDGIDNLHLVFNATGFVSSPRASYGVKSDLLFDVMERLREAGLSLTLPPTVVMSPATAVPNVQPGAGPDLVRSTPDSAVVGPLTKT